MRRALVLGDSHAHAFEHVSVPGYRLDVCVVEGATASGVTNPNSKTAAHATFERKLRWTPWWRPVVFLLGEVDWAADRGQRAAPREVPWRPVTFSQN